MWCCDVFPSFIGISGGFGVLEPQIHHLSFSGLFKFQAPKTLRFKGKMANFEATNTVKQRKTPKGQMVPISRVYTAPPTLRVPKPPSNKREISKIPNSSRIPKVNVISPKVNVISPKVNDVSPKVNVISPKVNVKYS